MFENIRHYSRWAVNGLALTVAVTELPELVAIMPDSWAVVMVAVVPVVNQVLSVLRKVA